MLCRGKIDGVINAIICCSNGGFGSVSFDSIYCMNTYVTRLRVH